MEMHNVDFSSIIRMNAELKMQNASLQQDNSARRAKINVKDNIIKDLNEKLDAADKKKNVRFLRPAKVAPGNVKEQNKDIGSLPEKEQPEISMNDDLLAKDHFTGYYHKFLKHTFEDSKWSRCERCFGLIKKKEEISQCIFCLECYHDECAFVTGKVCMSRGSIHVSQKGVD